MKETPILFNGPMVQSIRANIKTQTRRIIKDPQVLECIKSDFNGIENLCPFGDVLWVRETFAKLTDNAYHYPVEYAADQETPPYPLNWKPSIFMPREYCRQLLEVVLKSYEPVNIISDEDAFAEGVFFDEGSGYWMVKGTDIIAQSAREGFMKLWQSINGKAKPVKVKGVTTHYICYPWSNEYKYIGDSYRGKPLIQHVNPWVWVIKFKRI